MSHNYHLYRDGNPCQECGHLREESIVHIGHSGGGWVFMWRGWRDPEGSPLGRSLTTPTEWFMALIEETAKGAVITDSYGKKLTLQEFWTHVTAKRQPRNGKPANKHSYLPNHSSLDCVHVEGDDVGFYEFS